MVVKTRFSGGRLVAGGCADITVDQIAAKQCAVLFLEQAHKFLRKPVNFFLPGRFICAARQTKRQQCTGHCPADFATPGHAAAEGGSQFESSFLVQSRTVQRKPRKQTANS